MSKIAARALLIDWNVGFKRHWNGGCPSKTHAFNALSFMFPQGELFFVKVVKEVSQINASRLPVELKEEVKGFISQEATHITQHQFYNQVLENQGYENVVFKYIEGSEKRAQKYFSPIQKLALVAAYEHYTAILGNYLLQSPEVMECAPKQMSLIWEWHAVEETEHKAVCFDLYKASGGSWLRRVFAFVLVSLEFSMTFTSLYFNMLWRDGCLAWKLLPKTMWKTLCFFWGVKGVGWHLLLHGLRYLAPWFHPWKQNNKHLLESWLMRNQEYLKPLSEMKKH